MHSLFWSLKLGYCWQKKNSLLYFWHGVWCGQYVSAPGSWHDYCSANYESGEKRGGESSWGGKKMKIEKGNSVRRNDESLWERQVNNSSLQADRIAVPATTATIYMTRVASWRKYFQKKQINALQNWFQSKRHNNVLSERTCVALCLYRRHSRPDLCIVERIKSSKELEVSRNGFCWCSHTFLHLWSSTGCQVWSPCSEGRWIYVQRDLDDLWPRLTPVTDTGLCSRRQIKWIDAL